MRARQKPSASNGRSPAREGLTPAALADLLVAEQRACWHRGERVSVEEHLRGHPALREAPEAFPLIHGEFILREELGEAPALEEYQRRFPRQAGRPGRRPRGGRRL